MSRAAMKKPVRLELNNTGAWKMLGRFDAADEEQAALVMDAAEELVRTLHNSEDPKGCATLRLSIDDNLCTAIARWEIERGWFDARTGEAL